MNKSYKTTEQPLYKFSPELIKQKPSNFELDYHTEICCGGGGLFAEN